jgi:hypothetical protein
MPTPAGPGGRRPARPTDTPGRNPVRLDLPPTDGRQTRITDPPHCLRCGQECLVDEAGEKDAGDAAYPRVTGRRSSRSAAARTSCGQAAVDQQYTPESCTYVQLDRPVHFRLADIPHRQPAGMFARSSSVEVRTRRTSAPRPSHQVGRPAAPAPARPGPAAAGTPHHRASAASTPVDGTQITMCPGAGDST